MKKIYTAGLVLFLLTACSSEQENASPNTEQNTNVQDETLNLADTLTGTYNGIFIDKYRDGEKVAGQIALFGEDFEQFLKMLQETTIIKEPLPEEVTLSNEFYNIVVQGDKDMRTFHIEDKNGEPIVSLPTNDVFPTAPRKATNTNILDSIKALEAAEE